MPTGAISILGKGLGFVPTPTPDIEATRLDMRRAINNITHLSRKNAYARRNPQREPERDSYELPSKLRHVNYCKAWPTDDEQVTKTTERMQEELDAALRKPTKVGKRRYANLTRAEEEGVRWLEQQIKDDKLAIVQADKGGAIILTTPQLLKKKVLEKLENNDLYEKITQDPTKELHSKLVNLWRVGKQTKLVSAKTASKVMGISDNLNKAGTDPTNALSTHPHFRPGKSYYYPSLKIHKLPRTQLIPGVEPPIRLITAMQDGITKRSDVFLADRYLRLLERDFCKDLLIDSNDALLWLEHANSTIDHNVKRRLRPFSFDFKALYDSLNPELVYKALQTAMDECRDVWSDEKKKWILDLVELSMKSAVGQFGDSFYRQKKGVPTGGSLCVQLANITVYHVMRECVYDDEQLMERIPSLKRYIDDGAGLYNGTKRQYTEFINTVNQRIGKLGLHIDEHTIMDPGEYITFLDIQFTLDREGDLQTDLYIKPTDSRSYLQYGSSHPSHVFSAVVFSQCVRLRRIINCNTRLRKRLEDLKCAFLNSNYPENMVNKIVNKASSMERTLKRPHNRSNSTEIVPPPTPQKSVRVITTFGSDSNILKITEKFEPGLTSSPSLASSSTTVALTPPPKLFDHVKRTGPNLRNKLVRVKQMALTTNTSGTEPCNHRNCLTCPMISDKPVHKINGRSITTRAGSCVTYNIIYALHCTLCDKYYIGRTVRKLQERVGEHRRNFYRVVENLDAILANNLHREDDEFSPGLHLIDEHIDSSGNNKSAFNNIYRAFILDVCSPKSLDIREHKYIHELKTLKPFGINSVSPFGLPILNLFHG